MAAKGYTTAATVETYMGVTFSVAQAALCDQAIEAAENWIDREIGHAWLETGPITDTLRNPQSPFLRLTKPPIVSVTSLTVKTDPACAAYTLTEDTNFYVHSLRDGLIWSPYTWHAYEITVVYVPNTDDVPSEVQLATMALAANSMRLMPGLFDGADPSVVQRYQVGGELEVEFRKSLQAGAGVVPQQVLTHLDNWLKGYSIV